MASYHIAVDIGGTFTDVVIQNTNDGALWTAKTPSTPQDLASGFMSGVQNAIAQASADPSDIQRIFHGTTIATNAVIERTPSEIGLLTTKGFKYVLEIGRHDIPRRQNIYAWVKPERPVPPNRIFEISERLDRTGSTLIALNEDECREAARQLRDDGVEAVAVCFLYSYANPTHEERAAEILREELPGVQIALSSEVLPQFREFERTVATVLNAYVMPRVGRYLSGLESAAKRHGLDAPLFIMKSNGGVTSADMAARQAIHTVLSGPVAGVMGATQIADVAESPSFISVDVGGTSADICLVRDGEPEMTVERSIGGLPLQLPMLDIVTIGAGGGSIARPLAAGGLSVGPESAGADPGPVCYNQGGTIPTVTDARLVLGHLPPHLLGGEMPLDVDAARKAIQDEIATPLGLELAEAASGIVEIADNNMAGAMRAVSIGRGLDPKDFALLDFGGAGPMHACALASLLGMQSVIVPPTPGVLSTYGLLFTDLRNDYVQTFVHSGETPSIEEITTVYSRLESQSWDWLNSEGVSRDVGQVTRSADLRYEHQGWEITVDMPDGPITEATVDHLIANFHDLHNRLYTYNLPQAKVELVNLRVSASGALPRHEMSTLSSANGRQPEPESHRPALFSRSVGYVDTPVYRRDTLLAGSELVGPAIVEQRDTTTLLAPGFGARVDSYGNLVITGLE